MRNHCIVMCIKTHLKKGTKPSVLSQIFASSRVPIHLRSWSCDRFVMSPSRHSVYTCNEISALTVVCSVSPRRCTWHGVYKGVIPSKRLVTPAQGRSMSSTWRPRSLYRVKAVRVVTVVSVSWPPDVHATIGRSLDAPKRRLHRWVREIPLYLSVS